MDIPVCFVLSKPSKSPKKCIHNTEKYYFKDCGGAGIFIHSKHKKSCKSCGGSGTCSHNKVRTTCKECKGHGF